MRFARSKDDGAPAKGAARVEEPTFVEKHTSGRNTYETYRVADAASARAWLETRTITEPLYYIQVETPEGLWGVDKDGIYLVELLPWQSRLSLTKVKGSFATPWSALPIAMASLGHVDNFILNVSCGASGCEAEWKDGVRYQKVTVVRCPECRAYSRIDTTGITCAVRPGGQIVLSVER